MLLLKAKRIGLCCCCKSPKPQRRGCLIDKVAATATSMREMADLISARLVPGMRLLLLSGFAYIASVINLLTISYRTK